MELAAFASFAALVLAWIVLPVRSAAPASRATVVEQIAEPVAA